MAERYPTFRAGQKVTGAILASMQPLTVRKVADTTNATTTLTTDPELQISVDANAVYVIEGVLLGNLSATPDDDLNIRFTAPAGADGSWGGIGRAVNTAGGQDGDCRSVSTAFGTARSFGVDDAGAASPTDVMINGLLITSSTAGTLTVDWAKAQSVGAGTLTVYQDSWIKLTRIA